MRNQVRGFDLHTHFTQWHTFKPMPKNEEILMQKPRAVCMYASGITLCTPRLGTRLAHTASRKISSPQAHSRRFLSGSVPTSKGGHKFGRTGEEGGGCTHAVESLHQTRKIVVHGSDRRRPAPRVVHPLRGWLPAPNSVVGKNGSAAGGSRHQHKGTHGQQSQRGQAWPRAPMGPVQQPTGGRASPGEAGNRGAEKTI
jgi:hypothetical protein